jgi:membrane protein DedA with SNARE-associated domain
MIDIGLLAQTYGYFAVLIGTALQGEMVLLVCGFLAHQGHLNVWLVWAVSSFGAVAGDVIYFYLGAHYGDRLVSHLPKRVRGSMDWAKAFVGEHPVRVLLLMRYFFGVRMILPIVVGMSSIRFGRFIRYNLPTGMLWAGLFVGTGYLFGLAATSFVHDVERIELYLTLGLALFAIAYHYTGRFVSARHERKKDSDSHL